jgi:hypothetical protein
MNVQKDQKALFAHPPASQAGLLYAIFERGPVWCARQVAFPRFFVLPCALIFFLARTYWAFASRAVIFYSATQDLPAVRCLTPPSHVSTFGYLTTDHAGASLAAASAGVDLLLGSDKPDGPSLQPARTPSTTSGERITVQRKVGAKMN